jgi:hypothetical protein
MTKGRKKTGTQKEEKRKQEKRNRSEKTTHITVRASHFEDRYYVCPLVLTLPHSTPKYTWHWEVLRKVNDQRSPYLAA